MLRTYIKHFALNASRAQAKHVHSVTSVHNGIDLLQTARLQNIIERYSMEQLAVCFNDNIASPFTT